MNPHKDASMPVEYATANPPWQIVPSGDRCLIIEFAATADLGANRKARAAAAKISAAALPGVTDVVPALTTVGVHYRPCAVPLAATKQIPFEALASLMEGVLHQVEPSSCAASSVIEIPVCYGGEYGPDLEDVAAACGLTPAQVIELHSEAAIDVMMLGFAPGHPYVGRFDERLAPPRRATPRTAVAAGSIGLANRQTVIYPMVLPGGWNLIGRTPLALFDPDRESPCLLAAGDRVRFVPITVAQFASIQAGAAGAQ
jgi:KipI family sensor histidine kinase inhibitor